MCRRAHGSAFATFVAAPAASFEWLAGPERIVDYASTAQSHRYFCEVCGSVTPAPQADGDLVWMPAGALAGDCGARPEAHMFVDSRAPWLEIADAVPQLPGAPPGFDLPTVPAEPPATGPGLEGGCLCGRVRYRIRGEPLQFVNCHCSRCRRARGAAHASNLFVVPEQLEWLSGEADVRVFDLPGAARFGQNFCPECGSPVPRLSQQIGRCNVPAGSLHGDPGCRVGYHIYVGSKAPWFAIADDLPQFEAARPPSP
jgi:hypothetical protein